MISENSRLVPTLRFSTHDRDAQRAIRLAGGEPVAAPMPGTILDIKVKAGDSVKSGQLIAILEAMKMENEIFCPRDGVVAQVVATKGSSVDTGAPIIVLN